MRILQIDVKEHHEYHCVCNLYTGDRCVTILISEIDYQQLIKDQFFIRDGKEADSANVLNTTNEFVERKHKE